MKRIKGYAILACLVASVCLVGSAHAEQDRLSSKELVNMQVTATVQPDGMVVVDERVDFNHGDQLSTGIYRFIPLKYTHDDVDYDLTISDLKVMDGEGKSYPYVTATVSGQGITYLEIKTGPNASHTGVKTYRLQYRVARAMDYLKNKDQFYWNVLGNVWPVPVKSASIRVNLPRPVAEQEVEAWCYRTGKNCSEATLVKDANGMITAATFTEAAMDPDAYFNVTVGFPKGAIAQPEGVESRSSSESGSVVLLILAAAIIILIWRRRRHKANSINTGTPS